MNKKVYTRAETRIFGLCMGIVGVLIGSVI